MIERQNHERHQQTERPLLPALRTGWAGRCPNCNAGPMFERYLSVTPTCGHCGEVLHHHRADDLPAWIVMVLVGHILIPLLIGVENGFAPPLWVHALIWPPIVGGLTLFLLPRVKGAVVAMQWAWRMHGFDGTPQ
ncbi:MAG: DUF983 domain-containing protein [Pseudomonadota bacterium]